VVRAMIQVGKVPVATHVDDDSPPRAMRLGATV
jgi:hypothetical protein